MYNNFQKHTNCCGVFSFCVCMWPRVRPSSVFHHLVLSLPLPPPPPPPHPEMAIKTVLTRRLLWDRLSSSLQHLPLTLCVLVSACFCPPALTVPSGSCPSFPSFCFLVSQLSPAAADFASRAAAAPPWPRCADWICFLLFLLVLQENRDPVKLHCSFSSSL